MEEGYCSTNDGAFYEMMFKIERNTLEKSGSDEAMELHLASYAQYKGEKLTDRQIEILKDANMYIE